ncbi:MAG: S8 family serine peptidase, partial [Eubacterium sp.]|nr:S8 family serine peptidase [Eubacterium sp.]
GADAEVDEKTGEVVADFGDNTEHYSFAEDVDPAGEIIDSKIDNGVQEIITTEGIVEKPVGFITEEQAEDMLNLETEYSNGKFIVSNPYQTKRLCVTMKKGESLSNTYSAVKAIDDGAGFYVLQYDTEEAAKSAYEALSKNSKVSSVTCDEIVSVSAISSREGAELIQSDRYKKYLSDNSKNTPITVAVVDSGVDSTHPFLKDRMLAGKNFSNSGNKDVNGHGTHVAGIIADNTPSNVKILPVKVMEDDGRGYTLAIAMGIRYAVRQGADVINMSLGGICYNECEMEIAVKEAIKSGVTVCVASGNETYYTDNFCPARITDCVTVAAAENDGSAIAYFSNFGAAVDVTAPGADILSCAPGGGYVRMGGTSMACPFAAASAAMILTDNPSLEPKQVENKLKSFCTDMLTKGNDIHSGAGLLNFGLLLGDNGIIPSGLRLIKENYNVEFCSNNLPFRCDTSVYLDKNICTDRTFTIANSNPEVAEYDGRFVTPKKSGKTEITISLPNKNSVKLTINLTKTDIWTDYAAKSYAGGNGTAKSPYLI